MKFSDNLSNNNYIKRFGVQDLIWCIYRFWDIKNVSGKNDSSSQARSGQYDTVSLI